ncbi:hypothetical protein PV08_10437 [Exophiala spinifera]|uniref:J domain-containing protein n=1 Tax=Exophiala spinifera TaxID=91928 RepID=A0A0D1ZDR5_9EURO|nr:uncharacterized protein PV08_10437 [Exophiala spinifera]KIW11137.1 hypothetical protein PV08_10437 [Exophiala spinifera]
MTDHYAVLGVPSTATTEEIRAAYKTLARQHHPDKGGNASRFVMIQEAMEVLTDPDRRTRFDAGQGQSKSRESSQGTGGRYERRYDYGTSGRRSSNYYNSDDDDDEEEDVSRQHQRRSRNTDEYYRESVNNPRARSPQSYKYSMPRNLATMSLPELEIVALKAYGSYSYLYEDLWSYKPARGFPETWRQLSNGRERLARRHSAVSPEELQMRLSGQRPPNGILGKFVRELEADARLIVALEGKLQAVVPAARAVERLMWRQERVAGSEQARTLQILMDCLRSWLAEELQSGRVRYS